MSGWYGSMDMGGLGHPHESDGGFYQAHGMDEENAVGMTHAQLHPSSTVMTTTSSSGSSMRSVAKKSRIWFSSRCSNWNGIAKSSSI